MFRATPQAALFGRLFVREELSAALFRRSRLWWGHRPQIELTVLQTIADAPAEHVFPYLRNQADRCLASVASPVTSTVASPVTPTITHQSHITGYLPTSYRHFFFFFTLTREVQLLGRNWRLKDIFLCAVGGKLFFYVFVHEYHPLCDMTWSYAVW